MIAEIQTGYKAFKKAIKERTATTGTEIFDGIVTGEDKNTTFQDLERGIDEYRLMLDTDPIIFGLWQAIKLPILKAESSIQPASEDNADLIIAEEVEDNLFNNVNFTYQQWLQDILYYPIYGFEVMVKDFERVNNRWRWKRWLHLRPETIYRWKLHVGNGIEQQAYDAINETYNIFKIPQEKIFHIAYNMEGWNFQGKSVLRSAYGWWKVKDMMRRYMAIQAERGATGIPRGTLNKSASSGAKTEMTKVLQKLRSHEESFIVQTEGDFEIDFIGGQDFFGIDLKPYVEQANKEMVEAMLGGFLQQSKGDSAVGSFAKQKEDVIFYLLALESITDYIEDIVNNGNLGMQHIKQIVDLNYQNVKQYPKLTIDKLSQDDIELLMMAVEKAISGNLLKPQNADEEFLRKKLGLPEREMDEEEDREKKMPPVFQPKETEKKPEEPTSYWFNALDNGRGRLVTPELMQLEQEIDVQAIGKKLDKAGEDVGDIVHAFRRDLMKQLVDRGRTILTKKNKKIEDIQNMINDTKIPMRKLSESLVRKNKEIFKFGREKVRQEKKKIQNALIDDGAEAFKSIIPTVDRFSVKTSASIKEIWGDAVLRQWRGDKLSTTELVEEMNRLSEKKMIAEANKLMNESHGLGRNVELKRQGYKRVVRSEVLDTATCDPCLDVDGKEYDIESADFASVASGPFDGCLGREACRGINVGIEGEGQGKQVLPERKIQKVTAKEKDAINAYTSKDFNSINKGLRQGGLSPKDTKSVSLIDDALKKNQLTKNEVLFENQKIYRAADIPEVNQAIKAGKIEGLEFTEKAFVSTTKELEVAQRFQTTEGSRLFRINAPKGTSAMDVGKLSAFGEHESEILLQRNLKFKVKKIEKIKQKYKARDLRDKVITRTRTIEIVHMDVIP